MTFLVLIHSRVAAVALVSAHKFVILLRSIDAYIIVASTAFTFEYQKTTEIYEYTVD